MFRWLRKLLCKSQIHIDMTTYGEKYGNRIQVCNLCRAVEVQHTKPKQDDANTESYTPFVRSGESRRDRDWHEPRSSEPFGEGGCGY